MAGPTPATKSTAPPPLSLPLPLSLSLPPLQLPDGDVDSGSRVLAYSSVPLLLTRDFRSAESTAKLQAKETAARPRGVKFAPVSPPSQYVCRAVSLDHRDSVAGRHHEKK